jgi:hypothetical protein
MRVWELNPHWWDRFGWMPLLLGGTIILAEGLRDWGRRAMPLFSYTLAFALQQRKSTENLSQVSRLPLGISRWPAERHFSSVACGWRQPALGWYKRLSCHIIYILFIMRQDPQEISPSPLRNNMNECVCVPIGCRNDRTSTVLLSIGRSVWHQWTRKECRDMSQ